MRRSLLAAVLVAAVALAGSGARANAPARLSASIVPSPPLLERRAGGTSLSYDVLVRNDGPVALTLGSVRERVYDARGRLELEREITANGNPPALAVVGATRVAPGALLDVFSPFTRHDARIDVARIALVLSFVDARRPVPPAVLAPDATAAVTFAPVRPAPHADVVPLTGRLLVHDGNDLFSHHRRHDLSHVASGQQRVNPNLYALDFVRVDDRGNRYRGDPFDPRHWFTFGAAVVAPSDGTIVDVVDDVPDNTYREGEPVRSALARERDAGGFGNHIVLRDPWGRYVWLLHFEAHTARVRAGQRVRAGTPLGTIGFSGDALFPHLHVNATSAQTYPSQGVPLWFGGFRWSTGAPAGAAEVLDTGDLLTVSR